MSAVPVPIGHPVHVRKPTRDEMSDLFSPHAEYMLVRRPRRSSASSMSIGDIAPGSEVPGASMKRVGSNLKPGDTVAARAAGSGQPFSLELDSDIKSATLASGVASTQPAGYAAKSAPVGGDIEDRQEYALYGMHMVPNVQPQPLPEKRPAAELPPASEDATRPTPLIEAGATEIVGDVGSQPTSLIVAQQTLLAEDSAPAFQPTERTFQDVLQLPAVSLDSITAKVTERIPPNVAASASERLAVVQEQSRRALTASASALDRMPDVTLQDVFRLLLAAYGVFESGINNMGTALSASLPVWRETALDVAEAVQERAPVLYDTAGRMVTNARTAAVSAEQTLAPAIQQTALHTRQRVDSAVTQMAEAVQPIRERVAAAVQPVVDRVSNAATTVKRRMSGSAGKVGSPLPDDEIDVVNA